ncbi:MAG: HDIG domain-containing protein [Spirochaetia bacterium]|nr:HDIG domain-containing protein [Spirochaetia bacterium]
MKMKKETLNESSGMFSQLTAAAFSYLKVNRMRIFVLLLTLLCAIVLAFFKTAAGQTVASYDIDDYEIGQNSDITVIAAKSLPPDADSPVSIQKGEVIVKKGFDITEEQYAKLEKMAKSPSYFDYRSFAESVVFHMLLSTLSFFLCSYAFFSKGIEIKELVTECIFYLCIFAIAVLGTRIPGFNDPFAVTAIIPASFFAFIVAILFGQLSGVFFSFLISFAVLNAIDYNVVPFIFTLASSLSATRVVYKIERRQDMFVAAVIQAVLNVVYLFILKIIFNGSITDSPFTMIYVFINGFFCGILCLGMLTPLELILNTASPFRLMELSDVNNSVMKKMTVTAGGTYQHSMMVAQLAENACREIGANSLLARVGAYYHDIGKMENPEYFVENQSGENKHDAINPSLSVSIIKSHVKRGVEKAHTLRLPEKVIDIIREHHGNSVISYFYNEAKTLDPNVQKEDFAYSENPPSSRESAVVMLADTVEAACRSLERKSVPALEKFIKTLVNKKIETHQLDNCNLTFKDIDVIEDSFLQLLAGYYHSRIEYPDNKDEGENSENKNESAEKKSDAAAKKIERIEKKAEASEHKIEVQEKKAEESVKKIEKKSDEKKSDEKKSAATEKKNSSLEKKSDTITSRKSKGKGDDK